MKKVPRDEQDVSGTLPGKRVMYVMADQALAGPAEDSLTLREVWDVLWAGKWLIATVTAICSVAAVTYALQAAEWYRAEVLLAPSEDSPVPSLGGELGGLAALAGVSVRGGGGNAEAIAVLKSRDFGRDFIVDFELLPVFFEDEWDAQQERWQGEGLRVTPDVRDGVKFFHQNILRVSEDRQTQLVTLAVEWTQPTLAADWANELVRRLNSQLRDQALREAESNVAYLQEQIGQTNVVALQQSIGRLLESELHKLMLARGNEDFAFRVVDAASPPKERVRPKRTLIVVVGTLLGGALGVFLVMITHMMRATPTQ